MGKFRVGVCFVMLLPPVHLLAAGQSNFEARDAGVAKTFGGEFKRVDRHRHTPDDGSAKPFDLVPDSASKYELGSPTAPWRNVHVSSFMTLGIFSSNTLLNTWSPRFVPQHLGQMVVSSGNWNVWIATGTGDRASWKVLLSSG